MRDFRKRYSRPNRNILLQRNPAFIGRNKDLLRLFDILVEEGHRDKPTSCVIRGIGGVGKTQIAIEYTHLYQSYYDAIFWLRAEEDIELNRTFGAIGRKLKLFDTEAIDQPKVEKIQDWLQTTGKSFDASNYKYTEIEKIKDGFLSSIISDEWGMDHVLPLEPFDTDTGSKLLLRQLKSQRKGTSEAGVRDDARKICDLIGGLPLWISQASGYINLAGCTPAEYISNLSVSSDILGGLNLGPNEWAYDRAVETTFDATIGRLSREANDLLFMLAFLNHSNISEDLLLGENTASGLAFPHAMKKSRFTSVVTELAVGQLVRRERREGQKKGKQTYFLSIHKSLQEGLILKLNKDTKRRQRTFEKVVDLFRVSYPTRSRLEQSGPKIWSLTQKVLPHVLHMIKILDRSQSCIDPPLCFAELLADVGGINLHKQGFTEDARTLLKKANEILDYRKEPIETTLRGDILTVLGVCNDSLGISNRAEGLEVRRKALEIRQKVYNNIPEPQRDIKDELAVIEAEEELTCSLQNFNSFQEVRVIWKRCRQKYEHLGEDVEFGFNLLGKYHSRMAYVYCYEGNVEKAKEYARHGREYVSQAVSTKALDVDFSFEYANLLFQLGDHDRAIELQIEVLEARIKECGNSNVLTMQSRLNIGIMKYLSDKLLEAEECIKEVLFQEPKVQWPVENETRAKYYLSRVLREKEPPEPERAEMLGAEAKASLDSLLQYGGWDRIREYQSADDLPILYDYIVPWTCRLRTPRMPHP
ncbi:hypothetical protein ACLMJK_002685 [Lecanora helva]